MRRFRKPVFRQLIAMRGGHRKDFLGRLMKLAHRSLDSGALLPKRRTTYRTEALRLD